MLPPLWERRETAVSCGFDPDSLTLRSARRRTAEAGSGREVVIPVYAHREGGDGSSPPLLGVPVRLAPGRAVAALTPLYPPGLGPQRQLWLAARVAAGSPGAVGTKQGWTRVLVSRPGLGAWVALVLRDADWLLLRAALEARPVDPQVPQDAPAEHVLARHLARLDGLDGSAGADYWGRLALEVVSVRVPGRLADSLSLRWTACWGRAGFGAGSAGRETGSGDRQTLSDLTQHRFVVRGRPFRLRALPDWEREESALDLALPAGLLVAWSTTPVPAIVQLFGDRAPAAAPDPLRPGRGAAVGRWPGAAPQDRDAWPGPGPQDAR
ncbi:hypothetical protein V3N99_10065 [Dermatophilaceae bacterium Soc4.6]